MVWRRAAGADEHLIPVMRLSSRELHSHSGDWLRIDDGEAQHVW
jgi:hypothetical protein